MIIADGRPDVLRRIFVPGVKAGAIVERDVCGQLIMAVIVIIEQLIIIYHRCKLHQFFHIPNQIWAFRRAFAGKSEFRYFRIGRCAKRKAESQRGKSKLLQHILTLHLFAFAIRSGRSIS